MTSNCNALSPYYSKKADCVRYYWLEDKAKTKLSLGYH